MVLKNLRKKIDKVDDSIIKLLEKRKNVSNEIISIKRERGIEVRDLKREKEIVKRLARKSKDLDEMLISKVYEVIFRQTKKK